MSGLFISRLTQDPYFFFMWIFLVIISICFHEYCHAQVALWEDDTTARDEGHLTLNPLKQMGPLSLLMLAFIGFSWGQVPVNPQRMRRKVSPLLVSLAGPGANLLLYALFTILFYVTAMFFYDPDHLREANNALKLFFMGATINFVLFVFNMLPVPPLDGFAVFRYFSHRDLASNPELVKGVMLGLIFLAIFFIKYVLTAGEWLTLQWGVWLGLTGN